MIAGVFVVLIFGYLCCIIWRKCKIEADRKKKQKELLLEIGVSSVACIVYHKTKRHRKRSKVNYEMQIFSFPIIAAATGNFSVANKLGQGGFGPVYKGVLPDGQEIAIKRLSSRSGQGLVEFKNEAELVAKLQHTNLVRLSGLCIQNEENILIYEYLPNKSLDFHLFDSKRREKIVWEKRFNIIEGIAHGLIYLHHFSRLKVIHRDLKAGNILLDYEMNPKISDFGMAVILDSEVVEVKTKRVVGTYGYMSPEYVIKGIISTKTDVFSYGVLVLEIVSGKKNNSRYQADYPLNLIGFAWQLWNEGKGVELIDSSMLESCRTAEVLRCTQVALLCVQANAADRPSMLEVYSMLANETLFLPVPKQPAYFTDACANEKNALVGNGKSYSTNEVTISMMDAR